MHGSKIAMLGYVGSIALAVMVPIVMNDQKQKVIDPAHRTVRDT